VLTLPQAQQEYDEAKEIFDILNEQYIRELPLLLDTRIREYAVVFLNPSSFPYSLPRSLIRGHGSMSVAVRRGRIRKAQRGSEVGQARRLVALQQLNSIL
jgi:hypothetical protein